MPDRYEQGGISYIICGVYLPGVSRAGAVILPVENDCQVYTGQEYNSYSYVTCRACLSFVSRVGAAILPVEPACQV